jgi:hypothetical protein
MAVLQVEPVKPQHMKLKQDDGFAILSRSAE